MKADRRKKRWIESVIRWICFSLAVLRVARDFAAFWRMSVFSCCAVCACVYIFGTAVGF